MSDTSSDRPASSLSDHDDYACTPAPCTFADSLREDTDSIFGGFSFIFKHNSKHHPYDVADAPYPLCYDHFILDCDVIGVVKQHWTTGQLNYSDRQGVNPTRLLDIGCGTGTWIIEAARKWPETSFVGFDLCPIQPDVELLDDQLGPRISWVHGNFLKTPWPFEDGEFDYIIIRFIAKGVPELSWDSFFQEASRVLASGGLLEFLDEDIIFPRVPDLERLTSDASSEISIESNGSEASQSSFLNPPQSLPSYEENTEYDEDYLESLYNEVYTERNISLKPTAIIPYYLNIYFKHTTIPARIRIPFPDIHASRLATNPTRLSQQTGDPRRRSSEERRESDPNMDVASSDHSDLPDASDHSSSALSSSLLSSLADSHSHVTSSSQPSKGLGANTVVRVDRESQDFDKDGTQDLPSTFRENAEVALSLFVSAMSVLAVKEAMWERVLVNKGFVGLRPKSRDVQEAREAFEASLEIFVARLSKFLEHTLEYPFLNDMLQDILRDGKRASDVLDSTSGPESRPYSVDKELLSQISSTVLSAIFQQSAASPPVDIPKHPLSVSASEIEKTRGGSFAFTTSTGILLEYLPRQRSSSSNDALAPFPFMRSASEPGRNMIPVNDPLVTESTAKVSRVVRFFLAAKEVVSVSPGLASPLLRTSSESMATMSSSFPSES